MQKFLALLRVRALKQLHFSVMIYTQYVGMCLMKDVQELVWIFYFARANAGTASPGGSAAPWLG